MNVDIPVELIQKRLTQVEQRVAVYPVRQRLRRRKHRVQSPLLVLDQLIPEGNDRKRQGQDLLPRQWACGIPEVPIIVIQCALVKDVPRLNHHRLVHQRVRDLVRESVGGVIKLRQRSHQPSQQRGVVTYRILQQFQTDRHLPMRQDATWLPDTQCAFAADRRGVHQPAQRRLDLINRQPHLNHRSDRAPVFYTSRRLCVSPASVGIGGGGAS